MKTLDSWTYRYELHFSPIDASLHFSSTDDCKLWLNISKLMQFCSLFLLLRIVWQLMLFLREHMALEDKDRGVLMWLSSWLKTLSDVTKRITIWYLEKYGTVPTRGPGMKSIEQYILKYFHVSMLHHHYAISICFNLHTHTTLLKKVSSGPLWVIKALHRTFNGSPKWTKQWTI